ncbi:MAG: hypothetical protein Q7U75_03425, partial [Desulfobacterales bacterium]|nr:hypothetical protein [Desulfobacterales bacterium]
MPEESTGTPIDSAGQRDTQTAAASRPPRRTEHRFGRFLSELLALQCRCCRARQGVILQVDGEGKYALLAVHPPTADEQECDRWLDRCAAVAEKAVSAGSAGLSPVDGDLKAHAVIVPLRLTGQDRIVTAVLLRPADKNAAEATRQLLELMAGVVAMTGQHLAGQGRDAATETLHKAMGTLAAVNRQNRFRGMAMAFCNEVAAQWKCERVSVG